MEQFYDEVTRSLVDVLNKYKDDKATHEEVKLLFDKEDLLNEYENWENIETSLRQEIFEKLHSLNSHLLDIEKKILKFESINESQELEINIEDLSINSNMLSRNREPPEGFNNSSWYLPCYPTLNMIEYLHESENE